MKPVSELLSEGINGARVPAPVLNESRPTAPFKSEAGPPLARLISRLTSTERKGFPMCTGLLDYFPDALAEVANISYKGNQKHNPGEPLHWARGKSMDHPDCAMRHLMERGGLDPEGNRHSAQLVWRALAILQEELEAEKGLACPRGATELPAK